MPSKDLSGFGKAMFEQRMRERNMGMDQFGQFRMPTQEERLDQIMRLQKDAPPGAFMNRFREAIEGATGIEKGMGSGAIGASNILGTGFDNSALMQDPKFKQEDTMNQGMAVSEPYEEANKQAFSKNNPMNAISQETPVGNRVDAFLKGILRRAGGVADYTTGGLTDLDQKGDMPYQKRIKQRLGGLADFATLGITDFDGRSR